MATGPLDADAVTALQAERDALASRCDTAEAEVARLTAQVEELRGKITAEQGRGGLSLFDDADDSDTNVRRVLGDGSDPRALSLILGVTAGVAGFVAMLALINGNLFTPFGIIIVALAIGLTWAAVNTRIVPVEVDVTRGMVYVTQGESSHRFDVRSSATAVEMVGQPGETGWQLRFPRRGGLEPFVIDASMVDPVELVAKLREWRPEL